MEEEEYLQLSGIQHFVFCRRQWALIHLEGQWAENERTAKGQVFHERCHDDSDWETRKDRLVYRGMRVVSHALGLSGACDVVEFWQDLDGIPLQGHSGRWRAVPIEYKRGSSKETDADRIQLCAQAMALEEMLVCTIPYGYLYYEETRRREQVEFTQELRQRVAEIAQEMGEYARRGYTPKVKPQKHCNACSLKDLCLPQLYRKRSVQNYVARHITEGELGADPKET